MMEKEDKQEKINILGIMVGKRELFINGVIFFIIDIAFSVIDVVRQLPEGWREMESIEIETGPSSYGWWISLFLFLASYFLISKAIYGGKRGKEILDKLGQYPLMMKKFTLILAMLLLEMLLQLGVTLLVV